MTLRLAYLSQGKLFFKNGDLAVRQIDSRFGQEIIDRTLQRQQRREWKTQATNTPFSGSMLWGVRDEDPRALRVTISAVTGGLQPGELLFALETDTVGGLFAFDWIKDEERRLFHREGLHVRDLCIHPDQKWVAGSQRFPNGTANIGLVHGQNFQHVTEGDSVDEAPAWLPGPRQRLVYQSAGVARNAQGFAVGVGPFAIHQIDLENGEMVTLLESERYDYLSPRVAEDGALIFIRRPYEMLNRQPDSVVRLLLDIVLFPFRLLRALFHFLNFISLTFARKPLTTASGPRVEGDDYKTLLLRGRIIDAEKALREGAHSEAPSLVPPTWELVRRDALGSERVLAQGVVAYDIDAEGGIAYTNGTAVFRIDANSRAELLLKDKLIENLIVVR